MSAGVNISDDEARALVVDTLEVMTGEEFDEAQSVARRFHLPIERALADRSGMSARFLLEQIAASWETAFVDLKPADVDVAALRRVPEPVARRHRLAAFALEGESLRVAMADPRDRRAVRDVQQATGLQIAPALAAADAVLRAQLLYHGALRDLLRRTRAETELFAVGADIDAPELLDRILEYAAISGASDIHLEPYEHELLVRCRVDGTLVELLRAPASLSPGLAARIKALAGMRIDDRRSPQDGRLGRVLADVPIDLRVSSLPTYWGEKIVMRIVPQERGSMDLRDLGLEAGDYTRVVANVDRPFGMILVTGPTGSGKTTTLYSLLVRMAAERRSLVNISTIEDPIEFPLERISQVSVNPAAGVDFASGLRSLLRQDPDVIMVGEVRDADTATMAVRAALVGRLLLSTLHTNDAPTAIPRLLDMGIEPYLLASTLSMVISQRLVRRICPSCRRSVTPASGELPGGVGVWRRLAALGGAPVAGVRVFRGDGCERCDHTGYRGRVGLFEVLDVDDTVRGLITARADASRLRAAMVAAGAPTMFEDGLAKVALGDTTLDELLSVADARDLTSAATQEAIT